MDRNLLLAMGLSFAVLALWSSFQRPPPEPGTAGPSVPMEAPAPGPEQPGLAPTLPSPPDPRLPSASSRAGQPAAPLAPPRPAAPLESERIEVARPLYRAELTTLGAGLVHWELTKFHSGERRGMEPVVLTTGEEPWAVSLLSPFEELGLGDLSNELFELEQVGENSFTFLLRRDGIAIRKTYVFAEDTYVVTLRMDVVNEGREGVAPSFALRWPAHVQDGSDFANLSLVALQDGSLEEELLGGIGRPGFLGMSPARSVYEFPGTIEWAGSQTTYFLSAMLPDNPSQAEAHFLVAQPGTAAVAEVRFEPVQIPVGRSATREYKVYIGPKEPERLEAIGGNTLQSINLGWSWITPMTVFFGWMLRALYSFIPNYGVAIVLLTVLVRVVTAPLTNRQMRSMERMRALSPKLKELQEKYKDDRQKQSEETMRLYRQEKVNPLGGCLPMLLQLPVFIGLFYALQSSIELRQAPFFGWIDDLSAPETLFTIPGVGIPFRVLPLIMGATMVLQQRLTPMPSMDPTQARMMITIMPIMMTVVFYQFPSGLVLYWMVSNVLAIAHQRLIGRNIARTA